MNRFTLTIHNRGWKVLDACKYWGIRYATYNARCNNPRLHNQLESMCLGLSYNQLEAKDEIVWMPVQKHSGLIGKITVDDK